jgi:hypothetical protein
MKKKIKMDTPEMGSKGVDWIRLIQIRHR